MENRIIEIVVLGKPQSIIQREGNPITELIQTHILIEELNDQLLLYGVVKSFYCWNEDCNMEKCENICINCKKYKGNGVK